MREIERNYKTANDIVYIGNSFRVTKILSIHWKERKTCINV